MPIYFSASVNGFFIDGIHPSMPSDRKEITEDAWQHLLANQSDESKIAADAEGNPVLVNPKDGDKVVYTPTAPT